MLRRALTIMAALALTALSTASSATIVKPFTLRGMATEAHEVLRGEVIDEEVVYDAFWGRVYTHTMVRVDDALGGQARPGDVIILRQLGGVLDGLETHLVGTSDFTLGDEVVLFTRTDGALHYLVGMAQGSYFVVRDTEGVERVTRDTAHLGYAALPFPTDTRAPERTALADLWSAAAQFRLHGGTP